MLVAKIHMKRVNNNSVPFEGRHNFKFTFERNAFWDCKAGKCELYYVNSIRGRHENHIFSLSLYTPNTQIDKY